jgi:Fic-DOC domain mobile mystery protein B
MGLSLENTEGQTPLNDDQIDGLLISTITTRGELDEFEQQNIEQAILWTMSRSFKPASILTEAFIRGLHKRMYGDVWLWAGEFRKTNTSIGIDKLQIPIQLRILLDDTKHWIENKTYTPDEIAVRFKHRIVSIHCFPNGNGRHSRLMADIIIDKIFKQPIFSWGAATPIHHGRLRADYLSAVRKADAGAIEELIAFART